MEEEIFLSGFILIGIGMFFIFTAKSCVIETKKLELEKVRIERACPIEKTK